MYMKEKEIPVLPPDVNRSRAIFYVEGDGIRIGLGALRGVGQEAIAAVIKEREKNGAFVDFADFILRCAKHVNKRIVESLIYAGAFDCFGYHRAQYAAVYEEALSRVNAIDKQKAGAQISLFGSVLEEQKIEIAFPDIPEYDIMEKLSKEKSVLGVYVSGHPLEKYTQHFKEMTFNCLMLSDFTEDEETGEKVYHEIENEKEVTMGGIIADYKKLQTRSGSFMAFVTVEDMYGSVECVCFPKIYERMRNFLEKDKVVTLSGKISIVDEKAPSIIVDKIEEYDPEKNAAPKAVEAEREVYRAQTAQAESDKRLWLKVDGLEEADLDELLEVLALYEGETSVVFVMGGKKMSCSQKVNPNKALMAELTSFLPPSCIKLV